MTDLDEEINKSSPENLIAGNDRIVERSNTDKIISGVCGGLAKWLNIDSSIIRIIFIFLVFLGGWGFVAYLLLLLLIPREKEPFNHNENRGNQLKTLVGIVMILTGSYSILISTNILSSVQTINNMNQLLFPFFLFFISYLLWKSDKPPRERSINNSPETLYRSITNRKIAGVCGGFSDYIGVNSFVVRASFIILSFLTFGIFFFVYLVSILFVQSEIKE